LQQEELSNKMLGTGAVPHGDRVDRDHSDVVRLPGVGTGELRGRQQVIEEDDEEEELRKLQAEMAM
jgi:charged multivesicular body protein 4